MSITGQVGHVQLAKQTAFGTPNTTANEYRGLKVTGDSLVASNNPLVAEGEIGQGRDVTQAVPGGFTAAGAINGNLRARAASLLLEGAMGSRTVGGGVDTYRMADDLPTWTLEKKLGSASPELMALRYQDVMINTLNFSVPSGALATFSAGLVSTQESRVSSVGAPSYSATSDDLLVFHGGRILKGDTGSTVARDETFQSIEVALNNNVAADEFTVRPSRFLRSLTEGIRSLEINMTLVFENPDKYSQYTYGAQANTSPGYSFYTGALQIILGNFQLTNNGEDMVGTPLGTSTFTSATPSVSQGSVQAIQLNIPKLVFTGLPVALSTGRIVVTTSARALKANTEDIMYGFVRPSGTASLGV